MRIKNKVEEENGPVHIGVAFVESSIMRITYYSIVFSSTNERRPAGTLQTSYRSLAAPPAGADTLKAQCRKLQEERIIVMESSEKGDR